MALHGLELRRQRGAERGRVGKAHEAGDMREALGGLGQRVGLLVLDHLQAVLEGAQEAIGVLQIGGRVVGDEAARAQRFQRGQGAALAQRRHAAAEDQLLGLGEELDLADAAAPELDVVAGHRDLAPWPPWAWIWRLMEWMSSMAAKSRLRRQMKGSIDFRKRAPVSGSPAQARALMKAARSQFWPMPS